MNAPSLVDYIADSAGRRSSAALTERDLERIDYARRCLARAAKRVRIDLRKGHATGLDCHLMVEQAKRDASRALAGSPWTPTTRLEGSHSVRFMARHHHDGVTITVQAMSLAKLQDGIDMVEVDGLVDLPASRRLAA